MGHLTSSRETPSATTTNTQRMFLAATADAAVLRLVSRVGSRQMHERVRCPCTRMTPGAA